MNWIHELLICIKQITSKCPVPLEQTWGKESNNEFKILLHFTVGIKENFYGGLRTKKLINQSTWLYWTLLYCTYTVYSCLVSRISINKYESLLKVRVLIDTIVIQYSFFDRIDNQVLFKYTPLYLFHQIVVQFFQCTVLCESHYLKLF